jgi:hypothetical protein
MSINPFVFNLTGGDSMSFRDFISVDIALKKYNLKRRNDEIIDYSQISPVSLNEIVMRLIKFDLKRQAGSPSEPARCETLIYPLLREVWMRHPNLHVWSHTTIHADEDLTGIPDYLVARESPQGLMELTFPLLAVIEAKREDFIVGWGQCLAAMVAAQKLNCDITPPPIIYGIVTTGTLWEFAKLDQRDFITHPIGLSLAQPDLLLGVLDYIFSECEAEIEGVLAGESA